MAQIIIDGFSFEDLDGFYQVIYGLMKLDEDWAPAHNLNALNDMLYSGFGTEQIVIVWKNARKSRVDLGLAATMDFYQFKINKGKPYNIIWAQQQLDDLRCGKGKTLFDIIVEIFQDHSHIELLLD